MKSAGQSFSVAAAMAAAFLLASAGNAAAEVLDCAFLQGDRAIEKASFQFEGGDVLRYCQQIVLEPFRCAGPDYKIAEQKGTLLTANTADTTGAWSAAASFVYDSQSGAAIWVRNVPSAGQDRTEHGTCTSYEPQGLQMPP